MEVRTLSPAQCAAAETVTATAREGWSRTALAETLEQGTGQVFGLWQDEALWGVAVFQLVLEEASLEGITLLPEHRGKGMGHWFLTQCLDQLKAQGIQVCFLEVRSQNAPAIALYEHLGFTLMGQRKNFYRNPPDHALTYRLDLTFA